MVFVYSFNTAASIKDVNHDPIQSKFSFIIFGMSSSRLSVQVDSCDSIRRSEFLFVLVLFPKNVFSTGALEPAILKNRLLAPTNENTPFTTVRKNCGC